MKRIDSGYGMKIFMKCDTSDRQMEIVRRMYPNALVTKSLGLEKVEKNIKLEIKKIKYK